MRYVLGVDGGGTKTSVALATVDSNQDQQAPLAIGLAGPSNVRTVGLDNAIVELNLAVSSAFRYKRIQPAASTDGSSQFAGWAGFALLHRKTSI